MPRRWFCTVLTYGPPDRSTMKSLVFFPSLPIRRWPDGRWTLTKKFLEGMKSYVRVWPGPVVVCLQESNADDGNLDHIEVTADSVDFQFCVIDPRDQAAVTGAIRDAAVVFAGLDWRQLQLAVWCREVGVPLVYGTEYSLRTRIQIMLSETSNPLLRLRRAWFNWRLEQRYRQALALAQGVQCNGTPVFDAYQRLTPHPFLFFDTRIDREHFPRAETLQRRLSELRAGGTLRLVFSGRFAPMKGVDDLPLVAAELQRLGIDFQMHLFGGGPLEGELAASIQRLGLGQQVHLGGVLDFERELIPRVSREADLFVCPHRQGDPSCTYLETLSCGVPIVGYDNEAFAGLVRQAGVGWTTPLNRPRLLAAKIAELARERETLADAARRSSEFAVQHTFQENFERRIAHLLSCARQVPTSAPTVC